MYSEQFQSSFRAGLEQFPSRFRAVYELFPCSFQAVLEQYFFSDQFTVIFASLVRVRASRDTTLLRTFFRAVSEQFQSSFRVVSEQFQKSFFSISLR